MVVVIIYWHWVDEDHDSGKINCPPDHRPNKKAIENHRSQVARKPKVYSSAFCASLRQWCDDPPTGVTILERRIEEDEVFVRFTCAPATAQALDFIEQWPFAVLCIDGTFRANYLNLVLVGCSLCGKVVYRHDAHVRTLPAHFVLAKKEDIAACASVIAGVKEERTGGSGQDDWPNLMDTVLDGRMRVFNG